jgi:hypothetical protein
MKKDRFVLSSYLLRVVPMGNFSIKLFGAWTYPKNIFWTSCEAAMSRFLKRFSEPITSGFATTPIPY